MSVLVAVATKYGATLEIGEAVRDVLAGHGLEAVVARVDANPRVEDHEAVIVGSAVYAGRWLAAAREFVETNAVALTSVPVWLFSSGPVGDPPKPEEDPVDAAKVVELTGARGHEVFPGRLERAALGFPDRAIVAALRAPQGDFRDWEAVGRWAAEIASAVRAEQRA